MTEMENKKPVEQAADDVREVDLKRLLNAVLKKSWLIAIVAVVCAIIAYLWTFYFVTPQYQSSAMFYVNNSNISMGDASFSITTGDLSAAKSLVNSYIVILETRETLLDVADYSGVARSVEELRSMITAASVNDTEIFKVVVTGPNPAETEKIANAVAYILPKRISGIIEGTSAKVVAAAVVPTAPSTPNYASNTTKGLLLGAVLAAAVIVLLQIFDVSIRSEDDITRICKHPVLASVPDMTTPTKGGYYGYGRQKRQTAAGRTAEPVLIGGEVSFAASEAYKLLRTKLQYSFADDNHSRIIGVSSALTGEGKSLTAVNLAYTLSQLDKRVLLIDCDMRRPSLSVKLPIKKQPGLSGYLSGLNNMEDTIQRCGIKDEENAFQVMASGHNPPNPIELLSSSRMTRLLKKLQDHFDYIILDLPPVGEVSDALAVAHQTDGVLLVVRQNYCDRVSMSAAVRQFEFVGARILGVINNGVTEGTTYYSKQKRREYANARYSKSRTGRFLNVDDSARNRSKKVNSGEK